MFRESLINRFSIYRCTRLTFKNGITTSGQNIRHVSNQPKMRARYTLVDVLSTYEIFNQTIMKIEKAMFWILQTTFICIDENQLLKPSCEIVAKFAKQDYYLEHTTQVSSRPFTYGGHGNDPHFASTKYNNFPLLFTAWLPPVRTSGSISRHIYSEADVCPS